MDAAMEGRGDRQRRPAPVQDLEAYRGAMRARRDFTAYVGMLVFLASWAMLFGSLFFAYALVRARAPVWPPVGDPRLPLVLPAVNTAVIALSSFALQSALRSLRRGRLRPVAGALALAAGLGALFLALQLAVWVRVYGEGLVPSGGPYGSVFYALTSFHALHVLVGLVALAWLAVRASRGAYGAMRHVGVRLWAMYWHFVGAIWLVLYATFYLL